MFGLAFIPLSGLVHALFKDKCPGIKPVEYGLLKDMLYKDLFHFKMICSDSYSPDVV